MRQEEEYINRCNMLIQNLKDQANILALRSGHHGGSYDQFTSFIIGSLRAQIHIIKLKRNEKIRTLYTNYNQN